MHIRYIRTLLFVLIVLCMSAVSFAQIGVAITIGPPPLPVYEQPLCPDDGYIWTPGYWAYDYDINDYYWVPGTWVMAPETGFLWTPAYWGWGGDGFVFYDGYWGPHVGFYGGINYGFGYFGEGYEGGRWDGGHFFYNRSVNNVNITNIHDVYNTTINHTENHVSYNGGNGGISARPRPEDDAAARERHVPPVATQTQHAQAARANPQQRASSNLGKPGVAATPRPGDFNDRGAVPAKEAGAPYSPPNRGANQGRPQNNAAQPSTAFHPRELPPLARNTPNTGNPKLDAKYQQQQEKQVTKQQQERDKLQQKQDQEHVNLDKQKANDVQRAAGRAEPSATDAAIAAKTPAAATAVAAETAASEPGAVQEIKLSFDGKALIVRGTGPLYQPVPLDFHIDDGLALQVRNTSRPNYASYGCGGRHPHPCNCVIAGNNWLAKRSLAIKASTHFKACSGISTAPVSKMIGAWGLRRLISIAISCPFISGMR